MFLNPDRYDGKIIEVKGTVEFLKFKVSKKRNPYTVFDLTDKGNRLKIFSFGTPLIKEGDLVKVIRKYQKVKYVRSYIFYNEIDASQGGVEKIKENKF